MKAGYCSECRAYVWLNDDLSCMQGHARSCIRDVRDSLPARSEATSSRRTISPQVDPMGGGPLSGGRIGGTQRVMEAYVCFSDPRTCDVLLHVAPGVQMSVVEAYFLPLTFSKTMYNLGTSPLAAQLRDYVLWGAEQMWPSPGGNHEMRRSDITRDVFRVVPSVGRNVLCGVGVFMHTEANEALSVKTEYDGPSGEAHYYAYMTVLALIQEVASKAGAWGDMLIAAESLRTMGNRYLDGPSTWTSLQSIESVAKEGVHAALQALANEIQRLGLLPNSGRRP